MRKILVALMVCPLVALAQGPANPPGQGQGQGQGAGPGRGMGPGRGDPARMEKRMRLARTLGLAEALDLDSAQALKLGDTLQKYDDRRTAARKQIRDARETLRKAAASDKANAAEVDGAIKSIFEARTQLQASDRDMLAAISKDLPAEKRARAALFLGRFESRIERRMIMHRGPGGPGHPGGMGPGMMRGPGSQMGMGPGGMQSDRYTFRSGGPDDEQMDLCTGEDCPMDDEE
ncbi:periplasmic heavy metal sensor [Anaeromyxobacter oryzae]|uniref:Periplasmic heavy metal sensor n=1 Tax=Anaeromyxobacter oryzae TaxID=2918170 RepID=A0ABM7WTS2_9BACT|nr:periplasmic heavy metal sensor [Anaeromyxobacter oryzae]BDG02797.1 hypothetical protein AMOR_17930 [Anaeromyxobacter oryzae]